MSSNLVRKVLKPALSFAGYKTRTKGRASEDVTTLYQQERLRFSVRQTEPVFKERLASLLQCLFADCHQSRMFALALN